MSQNFAIMSQNRFDQSKCLYCVVIKKLTNQITRTKTQMSQFSFGYRSTNQSLAQRAETDLNCMVECDIV